MRRSVQRTFAPLAVVILGCGSGASGGAANAVDDGEGGSRPAAAAAAIGPGVPQQDIPTNGNPSAIHPESVTLWTSWDQIENTPNGVAELCLVSNGVGQQIGYATCNQSDVHQYFGAQGNNSNLQFATVDNGNTGGCIEGTGYPNYIYEQTSCSSYSKGTNLSGTAQWLIDNKYQGDCVSTGYGEVSGPWEEPCSQYNTNQPFIFWEWGWGNNPYPYQTNTIQPYSPSNPGWVMDLYGNNRRDGQPIDIAPYNGTTAQFWVLHYMGAPTYGYEIQLKDNTAWCLDKPGGQNANGTKLELWTCNGGNNQIWTFGTSGWDSFVNVESGTCLDTPLMVFNNPTDLEVWTCNGGMNQQWKISGP